MENKTKWYTYNQNNTGGYFDEDMPHSLFVEAHSVEEANQIAEGLGVYFDGCDTGSDCSCCGDRWSEPYGDDEERPDADTQHMSCFIDLTAGFWYAPYGAPVERIPPSDLK